MSSNAVLPGDNGGQTTIADVVSTEDLTRWAQIAGALRYLSAPLDAPPAPQQPMPQATASMASTYQNFYAAGVAAGVDHVAAVADSAIMTYLLGPVGSLAAWIIKLAALLLTPLAQAVLLGLDALRKGIDPSVGLLAKTVLAEFLGTEVDLTMLPLGLGVGDHLTRARAVGGLLTNQLEAEWSQETSGGLKPTPQPAQTFAGLAMNFGLANGIMGLIGGMVPYGHWEELRELGEEVATNIGLGRLVRRAIQPYVQILVQQPLTWYLNQKYLPSQFSESMLVNPFTSSVLKPDQVFKAMNLLGFSNDKIQAFIELHHKRLSVADVKLLQDNKLWDDATCDAYLVALGYPAELAKTVLLVQELHAARPWVDKLVSEMETEVHSGRLAIEELNQVVDTLPLGDSVKTLIKGTALYKLHSGVQHKPAHLSEAELHQAFEAGLITATDLTSRWTLQGLPEADQNTRLALLLLRLKRITAEEVKANKAYKQKLDAYNAKVLGLKATLEPPVEPIAPFPLG